MGSVASPTCILIINNVESDIGIQLQESGSDEFQLAPGGFMMVSMPVAASANVLTAVTVTTTDTIVEDGSVDYLVFGD